MSEIDLHRFDLNLLVVFDVLMTERSVSRAAERLGRTQSAISHSLARLRQQLSDPLLVRGSRGMAPTAFALELVERARPILVALQRIVTRGAPFEPGTSNQVFRLAAPDFAVALFSDLTKRLRAEAPAVTIEWTSPRETALLELVDHRIDVALLPSALRVPAGVQTESIGDLEWRCFGRSGHPAFRQWSKRAWARWPHLVVRVGDDLESPVNRARAGAGLKRRIGGWVPNFLAVAPVLGASDLLATLPAVAMAQMTRAFGLASRPVPFALAPLPHMAAWSTHRTRDEDLRWLLRHLRPAMARHFVSA